MPAHAGHTGISLLPKILHSPSLEDETVEQLQIYSNKHELKQQNHLPHQIFVSHSIHHMLSIQLQEQLAFHEFPFLNHPKVFQYSNDV